MARGLGRCRRTRQANQGHSDANQMPRVSDTDLRVAGRDRQIRRRRTRRIESCARDRVRCPGPLARARAALPIRRRALPRRPASPLRTIIADSDSAIADSDSVITDSDAAFRRIWLGLSRSWILPGCAPRLRWRANAAAPRGRRAAPPSCISFPSPLRFLSISVLTIRRRSLILEASPPGCIFYHMSFIFMMSHGYGRLPVESSPLQSGSAGLDAPAHGRSPTGLERPCFWFSVAMCLHADMWSVGGGDARCTLLL